MRKVAFAEGEYYHLYNRGVDKRVVFSGDQEYRRFLAYMHLLNTVRHVRPSDIFKNASPDQALRMQVAEPLVAIGAFCLMPNHFHLYVTPLVEGGVSKFMQRLQTAYTMYFNEKHKRSGALFQGTFKAQHVSSDKHAKYLFSYIHLNPAKLMDPKWKERGIRDLSKLGDFVISYPYSSCAEYIKRTYRLVRPEQFPSYFKNTASVADNVKFWLNSSRFREV